MKTVKIYKVECTKAYSMSEQGTGFSLSPWGANTEYYEGTDDGGKDYILPNGYEVAESNGMTMEIYDASGHHCPLVKNAVGKPAIISASGQEIWLKLDAAAE